MQIELDESIGLQRPCKLTKKEHDEVRAYRGKLYEERAAKDKVSAILTGFRFKQKRALLIIAIISCFSSLGQTFEGHSTDKVKAYHCLFKINADSSVYFIYNTPQNTVFGEYDGMINKVNDTLFHVTAEEKMGQYIEKSWCLDTFYVALDASIAQRLSKIEIEYSDHKTRTFYEDFNRDRGKQYRIKMPVDKALFNSQKGTDYMKITVNWKNSITRKWIRIRIPYGSAAHFTCGQKLEFDLVIKDGKLKTTGKPPFQNGHFSLRELE